MSLPPWERNDKQNGLSLDKFINAKQHNPRVTRECKFILNEKGNFGLIVVFHSEKEGILPKSQHREDISPYFKERGDVGSIEIVSEEEI